MSRGDTWQGIDRRPTGGQQREQRRLRAFQAERDLVIALDDNLVEVGVPGPARIDPQLVASLAGQQIPSAFDILGGERLAVVPFDALAQRKRQLSPFLVPRPAGGEVGNHRLHAGLRHILSVHDEVIEHPHHRPQRRDRRFLEDRHARRAVKMRECEDTAVFLG